MIYLGHNFAKVKLTDKISMNLLHPTDGSTYSVSLKAQQRIDKFTTPMQKCDILVLGHYHKLDLIRHKGVFAFTMPSFFGQSAFFDGKNLESIIGGIILTVKLDIDGELLSIVPEFVTYDEITADY